MYCKRIIYNEYGGFVMFCDTKCYNKMIGEMFK